jgi:hypothetical protein
MNTTRGLIPLLAVAIGLSSSVQPPSEQDGLNQQSAIGGGAYCLGCRGDSGSGSASSTECSGASMTIDVEVADGDCLTIPGFPLGAYDCHGEPCTATVERSWTNLPPSTDLEFCRSVGGWPQGQRVCLPTGSTNSGTGSATMSEVPVTCEGIEEMFCISVDRRCKGVCDCESEAMSARVPVLPVHVGWGWRERAQQRCGPMGANPVGSYSGPSVGASGATSIAISQRTWNSTRGDRSMSGSCRRK